VTTVGPGKGSDVTAREAEVLSLLGRHLTNVQIAEELCISVRTVESHVSALLRKMQLADRRSLARHLDAQPGAPARSGRRSMPTPITPFIGRAAERTALAAAVAGHRMVTAVGPGGVGKTRLALSVAADVAPTRRDGAWFVDLVHVTDAAMIIATVAETVGVPEQQGASTDAALLASLAGRDTLLVFDNCEHLLDGVRTCVDRILAECPTVTVLATSRSRLMLPYERVFTVPGLSVTDDGGDAVALFSARVTTATGDSTPLDPRRVAALCRGLDGMALAIELAAARYSTLGLDGLETGLNERLRFLTAGVGVTDRHRSLRDAIDWSYDLLTAEDRTLLRGVAVLASSFDVDAAHAVAAPASERAAVTDGLARLADDSLLVVERGERTRYRALETIRQYGVEQLAAAGEEVVVRARHEAWCRSAVSELGVGEPDDAWCVRLDDVVDDVRAALVWSAADEQRRWHAATLAADLARLLFLRGRPTEAQRRYEQAAELVPSAAERVMYLRLAAGAATSRYVGDDALRLLRAAADLAASVDDRSGAARDLAWMSIYIDRAPGIMTVLRTADEAAALRDEAQALSDGSIRAQAAIATAAALGARSDADALEWSLRAVHLAHEANDGTLESAALDQLIAVHLTLDDVPESIRVVRRRGDLMRTLSLEATSGFEHSDFELTASDVYLAVGDLARAGDHADALSRLPIHRDEEHLGIARRLKVDALAGHFDAVVRCGEIFRLGWERAGRPFVRNLAASAHAVAMVHGMLGDDERRAEWLRITIDLGVAPEKLAGCESGWAPTFDALLALHRDDPGSALDRLSTDIDELPRRGFWITALWWRWYAALWAEAAVLDHHRDAASRIERSRHAARDNPIATAIVERAAAIATGDRAVLDQCATTFGNLGCPYQQARTRSLATGLR
jgi:predicted ATPase/DNA-binding CsgD family transcriptional regulator